MTSQPKEVTATLQEIKAFDVPRRLREALEGLEREFKEYKINNIKVGIEAGLPAGFKGSVEITLTKK